MQNYCRNCGTQLTPGKEFCGGCGKRIQATDQPSASAYNVQSNQPMMERQGTAQMQQSGVGSYLKAGFNAGLASLKQMFKSPKQLIPILVLGVFWLALSLLPALGINPLPVKLLSFLTFAQGGMYGGVLGALGGVLGKAVFAYFVSTLLLPLFSGKNPFEGMGGLL